jgi:hypothetical protein
MPEEDARIVRDELRQCGMCQLLKRGGVSSEDGTVFICDQFAGDLHKMQDEISGEHQSPAGN